MELIAGTSGRIPPDLMTNLARFRHRVFVEQLGWELHCRDGLELDQFDRDDTLYVIAQDDDGSVIGTARLLPTTRPYLLSEVFPKLLHGLPVPRSPFVWELSRFAALDFNASATSALAHLSSPIAAALLGAAMRTAVAHGAHRLITVSPLGVERLLRRAGLSAHRAAPPLIVGGYPIFACWIDLERASVGNAPEFQFERR